MRRPATQISKWSVAASLLLVLVAAFAVRFQPWGEVFEPGRDGAAFLGDTDPYYHALRAERIAADYPRVPWRDEGMNYPDGADILWPPLFDHMVASVARLAQAGPPTRATVETVAAVLPPVLGVGTVLLVALLGFSLLGRGGWLGAALLVALLPAHVELSIVGRPDQHVAELLWHMLIVLAFVTAWRTERNGLRGWWAGVALGAAIALSFWNWQGSAFNLVLLAAFAAAWHLYDAEGVVARRIDVALARGAGLGSLFLFVSILLWGRPGALFQPGLSGLNGIQALLAALVALFALGLERSLLLRRGRPAGVARRVGELLAAGAIPLAAAWLLFPGFRVGVGQGLLALTAGNPWYASIREFRPLLFGGTGIGRELRAWLPRIAPLFAMPLAMPALVRLWRQRPDRHASIAFLGLWGGILLVLAFARLRFTLYAAVPAALWAWIALQELAVVIAPDTDRKRTRSIIVATGMLVMLAPALFYFSHGGLRHDPTQREVIAALEWLRARPVHDTDRVAVFSEWDWGHLVQYFAHRPAVATPFGTDGGPGAMEDATAFFLSTSPEQVTGILDRRRAGYLLMVDPVTHAAESAAFAPPGASTPVTIEWHWLEGPQMMVTPEVDDLVATRIYTDNGLSAWGRPSLDRYRLVYEGAPRGRQVRLFEIVPGAELLVVGAAAGAEVRTAVGLRTNRGRPARWSATAVADPDGCARIRVPFSTGPNGAVTAGAYGVASGGSQATVTVHESAVRSAGSIDVVLVAR